MSRSHKKHPVCKDGNRQKADEKARANRRFRRARVDDDEFNDTFRGKSNRHKRFSESWDISDYNSRETKREAIAAWEEEESPSYDDWYKRKYGEGYLHHAYGTLEVFLKRNWEKWYYRK